MRTHEEPRGSRHRRLPLRNRLISKNSPSGADQEFSTMFSVASRNTLLRFLALIVATFGGVTAMVDNRREMFGRSDVAGLGDCYNELRRELTFHELRRCRRELHTSRDRKRKVRTSEPSRGFDTPLTMPLKNPRFLCQSRPRYPYLFKAALNALVADERTVDGPEDLTHKTTAQNGFYTHRGLDKQASSIRPGALTPDTPPRSRPQEHGWTRGASRGR
jgi:hypothetical protein